MNEFPGRVALQQRVLPSYRVDFFDTLAEGCGKGLSVFAGKARQKEAIKSSNQLQKAVFVSANNVHIMQGPFYMCWQDGLLKWLGEWNPDALIVEANPRYPNTHRAINWMHTRGRPVIGWGLGAPPVDGIFSTLRKKVRHNFIQSLDGIISYSELGASQYRAMGVSPERVFVAYNAAAHRPNKKPRERPEIFSNKPVVLFVGRLQIRKRLDLLFKACARQAEHLQPYLVIIGEGPAKEEFMAQAKKIYPKTEFVGAKYGTELDKYFEMADLFVLPGTGGLAIQQAMAHGLPVIVAEGDGTQKDLVRPKNGWLVPPDDPDALTDCLLDALSNVKRLRRMGAESYRIATEEVNIEAMAQTFINVLNTLVENEM
jgi:glycosyltransferase involved in cell wall biosynthesis